MIQATFQRKHIAGLICMGCGLLLIGLFVFIWFMDPSADILDLLSGIAMGVIICLCAAVSLLHNYGAYLCIDETGNVRGKYHYFGKIHCHVSQISFATGHMNNLVLIQNDGTVHSIIGIDQPWLFANDVLKQLDFQDKQMPSELMAQYKKRKKAQVLSVLLTALFSVLMFVILFVAAALTGQREMEEFTKVDWWIFAEMMVVFFIDMCAMFYCAMKIGKHTPHLLQLQYQIHRRLIETQPLPGNPVKIYADANYTGRMVVCGFPQDASVYYIVERFGKKNTLDKIFQSEIFENIDCLTESVAALIDITDTIL